MALQKFQLPTLPGQKLPEFGEGNLLFTLKEVTYSPETPRLEEPFVVKGKVELFGIPFLLPIWVIAKVTAPETWWEHYIPIWGSPTVGESQTALGGDFEIKFPRGFDREGEFALNVEVHAGPTYTLDSITLPPFPPLASENTTFIVSGEVPPEEADIKDFDFKLTKGTYNIRDKVSFTAPYDYKGIAQDGQLTIEIGTGIYPTFNRVYGYDPIAVSFPVAADWETRGLEGNITLPDVLEPGQTYSVRAKLETLTVKTQETDTDWSAFDITAAPEMEILEVKIEPLGAGYVTTSPAPSGGVQHNWQFPHGTTVYVTAHPNAGYVFKSWSGEMTDTTAITASVYPMTEHRLITAHFEQEIVAVEFSLSKPTAYPYRAPPGPVLITCPVTLLSSQSVTAQVKCIVYEGSFWTGHGTKLWESTKTITISSNDTKGVQFMRTSVVGTIDRRDVGVEVRVGGQLIAEDEWDDVYYVEEAAPVGISFSVMLWGTGGFGNPDSWWCDYWDPGVNDFVGDKKWHKPYEDITFSNVQPGGYLAVFLLRNSTVSSQFTSPTFQAVSGGRYQYDLDLNRISKIG